MTLTYYNFETFARPSLAGLTCHSVRRKVAGHVGQVFTRKLEVTRPPFMLWYVQLWRRVGCTYHSLGALRLPSEVDVNVHGSGLYLRLEKEDARDRHSVKLFEWHA